jgi:hypothetical protein
MVFVGVAHQDSSILAAGPGCYHIVVAVNRQVIPREIVGAPVSWRMSLIVHLWPQSAAVVSWHWHVNWRISQLVDEVLYLVYIVKKPSVCGTMATVSTICL